MPSFISFHQKTYNRFELKECGETLIDLFGLFPSNWRSNRFEDLCNPIIDMKLVVAMDCLEGLLIGCSRCWFGVYFWIFDMYFFELEDWE